MANGVDQDLAVVLFSGHGVTIDNHFYLLPYGVDARTPAGIKASAISATEFHDEIEQVANYGRVLVLLDACHSGAVTADGFKLSSNADFLRSLISASNVTVLTSSTANEFSREDQNWGNGAFTKILMEALGHDADENHDGVISMSELTRYIANSDPYFDGKRTTSGDGPTIRRSNLRCRPIIGHIWQGALLFRIEPRLDQPCSPWQHSIQRNRTNKHAF